MLGDSFGKRSAIVITKAEKYKVGKREQLEAQFKAASLALPMFDYCKLGVLYAGCLDDSDEDVHEIYRQRKCVTSRKASILVSDIDYFDHDNIGVHDMRCDLLSFFSHQISDQPLGRECNSEHEKVMREIHNDTKKIVRKTLDKYCLIM